MKPDDMDNELFELLLQFVLLSKRLASSAGDRDALLLERMDLAAQLRQRGFMISEQQLKDLEKRLLH